MENESPKIKKPVNITALAMVLLSLSIIFVIVAYGYGEHNQAVADNKWYTNYKNLNSIANNLGYSLVKNEPASVNLTIVPINNVSINITPLANVSMNLTPIKNMTNTTPLKNITGGNRT